MAELQQRFLQFVMYHATAPLQPLGDDVRKRSCTVIQNATEDPLPQALKDNQEAAPAPEQRSKTDRLLDEIHVLLKKPLERPPAFATGFASPPHGGSSLVFAATSPARSPRRVQRAPQWQVSDASARTPHFVAPLPCAAPGVGASFRAPYYVTETSLPLPGPAHATAPDLKAIAAALTTGPPTDTAAAPHLLELMGAATKTPALPPKAPASPSDAARPSRTHRPHAPDGGAPPPSGPATGTAAPQPPAHEPPAPDDAAPRKGKGSLWHKPTLAAKRRWVIPARRIDKRFQTPPSLEDLKKAADRALDEGIAAQRS